MTIRADSYSSTSEIKAFTRYLLQGQTSFNSTTQPTLTEVEKFIDRASGVLNVALAKVGLSGAAVRANSTAKLMCDDWVTAQGSMYVEMTQRGTGYSDREGNRSGYFSGLYAKADKFCKDNALGFKYLGVTQSVRQSQGLAFTGLTAQADRADQEDTSLAQPFFSRSLFDDRTASKFTNNDEEDDE